MPLLLCFPAPSTGPVSCTLPAPLIPPRIRLSQPSSPARPVLGLPVLGPSVIGETTGRDEMADLMLERIDAASLSSRDTALAYSPEELLLERPVVSMTLARDLRADHLLAEGVRDTESAVLRRESRWIDAVSTNDPGLLTNAAVAQSQSMSIRESCDPTPALTLGLVALDLPHPQSISYPVGPAVSLADLPVPSDSSEAPHFHSMPPDSVPPLKLVPVGLATLLSHIQSSASGPAAAVPVPTTGMYPPVSVAPGRRYRAYVAGSSMIAVEPFASPSAPSVPCGYTSKCAESCGSVVSDASR